MDNFGFYAVVVVTVVLCTTFNKLKRILHKHLQKIRSISAECEPQRSNHEDLLAVINRSVRYSFKGLFIVFRISKYLYFTDLKQGLLKNLLLILVIIFTTAAYVTWWWI